MTESYEDFYNFDLSDEEKIASSKIEDLNIVRSAIEISPILYRSVIDDEDDIRILDDPLETTYIDGSKIISYEEFGHVVLECDSIFFQDFVTIKKTFMQLVKTSFTNVMPAVFSNGYQYFKSITSNICFSIFLERNISDKIEKDVSLDALGKKAFIENIHIHEEYNRNETDRFEANHILTKKVSFNIPLNKIVCNFTDTLLESDGENGGVRTLQNASFFMERSLYNLQRQIIKFTNNVEEEINGPMLEKERMAKKEVNN